MSGAALLAPRQQLDHDMLTQKPILAFIAFAAILLFLALAIFGWGGFAAFFANGPRIALAIAALVIPGALLFSSGNISPGEREDRANRWVLIAFGLILLLAAYLPAYTDRNEILVLDGNAVRWLGVVLFIVGGALRLWPVFVLGRQFSGLVAIQAGHRLITDGAYGVIRHPSYLGLLINALGWVLTFRSVVGVVLVAFMVPPLLARIKAEERLLRSEFGAKYDAYCNRTSRLIPGLY
jgi:protein-S-isoprenylcysteine O-methyltransferase Ste14